MELIDKSTLVEEINSRININETCQKISGGHEFYRGAIDEAKEILSFINSLEVRGVDLEREINDYFITVDLCEGEKITENTFRGIAKHFFELGLKAQKGE